MSDPEHVHARHRGPTTGSVHRLRVATLAVTVAAALTPPAAASAMPAGPDPAPGKASGSPPGSTQVARPTAAATSPPAASRAPVSDDDATLTITLAAGAVLAAAVVASTLPRGHGRPGTS